MSKVYNFNAGPAMLPIPVMEQAQREFLNWHNCGMSVIEISHRGDAFLELINQAERDLRDLLNVPKHYRILFMHGGARGQFAAIPMNLLAHYQKSAYAITGIWGQIAAKEAQLFGDVKIITNAEDSKFTTIPAQASWDNADDCAYLHYVDNETVNGVEFNFIPKNITVPLIADMSSNFLSRPFDINQFGMVYAGAQKNIAPAGIAVVIIREDLLERKPLATTPSIFRYKEQAEQNSLLNTPTTFSWYMAGLVFKWIKAQGGLTAMAKHNERKSKKLYDYIEQSEFYTSTVERAYRSQMNVVFRTPNEELDKKFVAAAEKAGLHGLKGHRYVGGLRASIYNAMPETGVDALLEFMQEFRNAQIKVQSIFSNSNI